MSDEQRMVNEFHRAFDIAIGASPHMPDEATCTLRIRLIQKECDELQEAFTQHDVVATAKALADLLYVVYGTAVSCGIDIAPVFREVHRSNMSKVGVRQRADGTWIRPPGYAPARLQPLLAAQGLRAHHEAGVRTPQPNGDLAIPTAAGPAETSGSRLVHVSPGAPAAHLPTAGDSVWDSQRVVVEPPSEQSPQGRPARQDSTRMREHLDLACSRCGKSFVRRSHRKSFTERLLSWVYIYPFRCQICGNRFKAFQFRIRYAKQLIDRRQYERLPTHLPATFTESVKPGESRVGEGIVTDISLGGCYLQTVARLLEGTLVSLELQMAAEAPAIAVEAAIIRSVRPTGVGLEFLRLHEPDQERLSQFMRRLLTEV